MKKQVTFNNNIEIMSTCDYDKANKVTLEKIIHEFSTQVFFKL